MQEEKYCNRKQHINWTISVIHALYYHRSRSMYVCNFICLPFCIRSLWTEYFGFSYRQNNFSSALFSNEMIYCFRCQWRRRRQFEIQREVWIICAQNRLFKFLLSLFPWRNPINIQVEWCSKFKMLDRDWLIRRVLMWSVMCCVHSGYR